MVLVKGVTTNFFALLIASLIFSKTIERKLNKTLSEFYQKTISIFVDNWLNISPAIIVSWKSSAVEIGAAVGLTIASRDGPEVGAVTSTDEIEIQDNFTAVR